MKCNSCNKNDVLDLTDNPLGMCNRCRWDDVISRYDMGGKHVDVDMPRDLVDQDKQNMVDTQWEVLYE